MYGREVGGRTLTFGVSGKLILNNLVMYDHQTESYWPQAYSRAIEGPMRGAQLKLIPSQVMDWDTWRELHPDTLVLDKGAGFPIDTYASYYRGSQSGVIGRAIPDNRLPGKELVIGLQLEGAEKAYPYRELSTRLVVNDTAGEERIVVTFNADAATGAVWDRVVGTHTLNFHWSGENMMTDQETGSTWDVLTGLSIAGPLTGEQLRQFPTTPSFWFAWLDLFPDTGLYSIPVE